MCSDEPPTPIGTNWWGGMSCTSLQCVSLGMYHSSVMHMQDTPTDMHVPYQLDDGNLLLNKRGGPVVLQCLAQVVAAHVH